MSTTTPLLTPDELLIHWQGHRSLTRKVIEAFPEDAFLNYSIGGMRPFIDLSKELLAIAAPGLKEIISGNNEPFDEERSHLKSKEDVLNAWDNATKDIDELWKQIPPTRFAEMHNLFGQYNFPVIHNILYFIDNEVHHRGQGYVYLRSLGIEPPFFWER